jgi:selenocysteine lyase/cysteine desulfurase
VAALSVLEEAGWDWIHGRAASLAEQLASRLAEKGVEVRGRGRSTLVSWHAADSQEQVERLAAAGIIVRNIPAYDLVRVSVGAWSSEDELDRLAELACA